jgi:REP element-mobilizing transposase RayT
MSSPKRWHSRGYLPHFDGGQIAQTITFRLADSLPRSILEAWKHELARAGRVDIDAELRQRIEAYLDRGYGDAYLRNPRVAGLVQDALLYFDGERYRLSAWVVMPNHLHFLLTPAYGHPLSQIMKSIKSYTSHEANRILGRKGQFWMEDYFDRYIRDAKHFAAAIAYIENNPVKAGLCKRAIDWQFSSAAWDRRLGSAAWDRGRLVRIERGARTKE